MRQDGLHQTVLRELRGHFWEVLATSRVFWWWGKGKCQSVLEERQEGSRVLQASQSHFSVPGKVMEQILWEAVSRHTKDKRVIWPTADIYQGQIMLYPPVFPLWCDDCLSGQGQSSRCWLQEDFWHSVLTTRWVRYWLQKWTVRWAKVWLDLWVQRFVKSSTNGVPLG